MGDTAPPAPANGLSRRAVLGGGAAAAAVGSATPPATAALGGRSDAPASAPSRLWYDRPATEWVEALPVGNGRIGAMLFGGGVRERLQLNEDTLWTGGPYDPVNPAANAALPQVRALIAEDRFVEAEALADRALIGIPGTQMAYQALGDLLISFPALQGAEITGYRRELDLATGIASTAFSAGSVRLRQQLFASAPDDVLIVRIEADRPVDCDVAFTTQQASWRTEASGATLMLAGRNGGRAGIAGQLGYAARLVAAADGGTTAPHGPGLRITGLRSATLLVALATSFRRFDDVSGDAEAATAAVLRAAAVKSFRQLKDVAVADHRRLFDRVSLDLGHGPMDALPTDRRVAADDLAADPGLAKLYFDYGRYLLIASSRPGSQPANLQGIWNDSNDPPWQSKYTVNINTQMNYWPAEVTGLAECTEPLLRMVRELAESGARTARTMYGARGWVCHHNSDLWRATAPIDGAQWGMWPTGGAWLATHIWDRYDHGRDIGFLRAAWPVLRDAALFFLGTLQADATSGSLVTSPSISPENRHMECASLCAGPAMDRQILRDLFGQAAAAADILGTDADLAADFRAAAARLAPDRIGAQGQLQEWLEDWDARAPEPDHRHVSHLYGLFPSHQIDPVRTPALARAARRSLDLRGDRSTGWATAWRANLWARLGDGDRAHAVLAYLLGPGRTYPNLFDAHPPFQIDGNFGGTRAIAEMMMQSHGQEIRLLPALPRAWPEGRISGLHARGRTTVDLRWKDGMLDEAVLRPALAGRRTIMLGDHVVAVDLRAGQPLRLVGTSLTPG